SEIIMLTGSERRISRARWPEETGRVSKPWVRRKESSRLRWLGSSSTIRMRGGLPPFFRASAGIEETIPEKGAGVNSNKKQCLHRNFQMRNAKDCSPRLIGQAFDFPTVRQHNLLDDGQAEPRPLLLR